MLNAVAPSRHRLALAIAMLPLGLAFIAGAAHAASPGTAKPEPPIYQLVTRWEGNGAPMANATVCLKADTPATIRDAAKTGGDAWEFGFHVTPAAGDLLQVDVAARFGDHPVVHEVVRGKPGEAMAVQFPATPDSAPRTLRVSAIKGCPAAAKAAG
ncbi:hypothetical protein SAMN02800692_2847 [Luteibacter sp. UNC138MFCol5.1]|uniref:hypothetical protein n=1 Tax=Luteibacter sp. UNC138MFCol5.1 TaxID=1502774 RepID=UPI0008D517A2|nr:hypothetical protein [Luteibacter sp. UNC138MFCol5.1]SEO93087.1 hypothetical protein SAMN02800692_2847 [Luteibacter sp. UNC138MFCol5.1]